MSIEVDILDIVDAKAAAHIFINQNQELTKIYTEEDAEFLQSVLRFRSEFGYLSPILDVLEAKLLLRKFDWESLPIELPPHMAHYLFSILKIECRKYWKKKFSELYREIS